MIFSAFERMVAWRYFRAKRRESFIAVITGFSLIGIALGVATLIIVMSVMNGFRHELVSRILGLNGHLNVYSTTGAMTDYIYNTDLIKGVSGVTRVTPTVEAQALVTARGLSSGAVVRGISVTSFAEKKLLFDAVPVEYRNNFRGDQILIGHEMARRMGVKVGDHLTLVSPKGKTTPFGTVPRSRAYPIGGIFDVGMFEYDSGFVFMPLETAQQFFQFPETVTTLEIMIDNPQNYASLAQRIATGVGTGYYVTDWQEMNSSFFNALQVERNVMFLILTMIILVAAFNIISSLIMLVKDKGRDIAILRTMGATKGAVMRIFFLTGARIGVMGTVFGAFLGILIALNIGKLQNFIEQTTGSSLFPAEVYFLSNLPSIVEWEEVFAVVAMALFLSFAATIYPSWRAAKLDPIAALRYE